MSRRRDLMHFYVVFFFCQVTSFGCTNIWRPLGRISAQTLRVETPPGGRLRCFGTLSSKALTLNGPSVTVNGDLHVSPSQTTEQIYFIFFNRAEKKMVISANQRVNSLFIYLCFNSSCLSACR